MYRPENMWHGQRETQKMDRCSGSSLAFRGFESFTRTGSVERYLVLFVFFNSRKSVSNRLRENKMHIKKKWPINDQSEYSEMDREDTESPRIIDEVTMSAGTRACSVWHSTPILPIERTQRPRQRRRRRKTDEVKFSPNLPNRDANEREESV